MLDRFSATIQSIYAAAGGEATWSDALLAIEDFTGSSAAVINLVPKTSQIAPKNLVGNIAAENVAEYERDYMAMCPRVAAGLRERVRNHAVQRGLGFFLDAEIHPERGRARWMRIFAVPVAGPNGQIVGLQGL